MRSLDYDRNFSWGSRRGATLVEYAITTAILVGVFVVVGQRLFEVVSSRGNASANTVRETVPCGGDLGALRPAVGSSDPNPCL
jgi:Flp pilus assembly pilin Flp